MSVRILVADDSETILLLLRTRLEMAGYEVETAVDGQDAVERLGAGEPPDVILLDAMMPRMSGIDALRELRGRGDRTPALIVSAHQGEMDAAASAGLGIDGFVTKPIDFDLLFRLIDELTSDGDPSKPAAA